MLSGSKKDEPARSGPIEICEIRAARIIYELASSRSWGHTNKSCLFVAAGFAARWWQLGGVSWRRIDMRFGCLHCPHYTEELLRLHTMRSVPLFVVRTCAICACANVPF